jgi:hypothetical protein
MVSTLARPVQLCRIGSSKESRFHPDSPMKNELSTSVELAIPKLKRKRRFGSPSKMIRAIHANRK